MIEYKIYLDPQEFHEYLQGKGITNRSWPQAHATMSELNVFKNKVLNDKQSLDELLEEIGHFMRKWGETISVRPTRPIDTLSDQALAGMEALSAALIKEEVSKIAYEQIMAFANGGFLGEKFRNYNP